MTTGICSGAKYSLRPKIRVLHLEIRVLPLFHNVRCFFDSSVVLKNVLNYGTEGVVYTVHAHCFSVSIARTRKKVSRPRTHLGVLLRRRPFARRVWCHRDCRGTGLGLLGFRRFGLVGPASCVSTSESSGRFESVGVGCRCRWRLA